MDTVPLRILIDKNRVIHVICGIRIIDVIRVICVWKQHKSLILMFNFL